MKKWGSLLLILSILFTSVPTAFAAVRTGWDFKYLRGIATDSAGRLYVPDAGNHRVQVFNSNESLAMTIGETGKAGSDNSHLSSPRTVAVEQTTGDIYILDIGDTRIQVFGSAGAYIRTIALPQTSVAAEAIALDGRGHVFVSDQNYQVYRMNTDGTGYRLIATSPQLSGRPLGIATDSKGNLYISQNFSHSVMVYSYNSSQDSYTFLKYIGEKGVLGADNAHFNNPWGVYVDRNDRVYVSDYGNKRVQIFNSNGSYAMTLAGSGMVETFNTTSDSEGNIYVVDSNSRPQVFLFNAQGEFVKFLGQNIVPAFDGSQVNLTAAQNGDPVDIKPLLRVSDSDPGQTLTWSLKTAPGHGTVSLGQATAESGGAGLAPTGPMTYQPAADYFGVDSFIITINDGAGGAADRMINVNVKKQAMAPTANPASGSIVQDGDIIDLSTPTAGAAIYYTLDGSQPTADSSSGTSVTISGDPGDVATVKAIAIGPNLIDSQTAVFTYTLATPAPTDLRASAGDGQADLTWNAAQGTVTYSVYQGTESGNYGLLPVATVEGTSYAAAGLQNGTTYYFTVKAVLSNGLGGYSNEISVTPMSGNTSLTGLELSAGELSPAFSAGTTRYTASVGNETTGLTVTPDASDTVHGTVTVSVYDGAGLLTGGPYVLSSGVTSPQLPLAEGENRIELLVSAQDGSVRTYAVTVTRAEKEATPTEPTTSPTKPSESPTATPSPTPTPTPDQGGTTTPSPTPSPTPSSSPGLSLTVNGQPKEQIVTTTISTAGGQSMLNATVDAAKLLAQLAAAGDEPRIVIPASGQPVDGVSVALTADLLRALAQRKAVLEVQSPNGSYTLPVGLVDLNRVTAHLGAADRLSEITVRIEVLKSDAATAERASNAGLTHGFSVASAPVEFRAIASFNGTSMEINRFSSYVKREIPLPAGTDPSRITTAIVLDKDGTVRHVPTFIQMRDGKAYAVVNSLTNSAYALIYHPAAFDDVKGHWAESAVNDLASRMVVSGVDSQHYSPDAAVTRAEITAIIVRALGLAPSSAASAFTDVSSDEWYAGAVAAAQDYSLVQGLGGGAFGPSRLVTREEALTLLARAMTLAGLDAKSAENQSVSLGSYRDGGTVSAWAQQSVTAALESGLVQGTGKGLEPKRSITRAETAALVQRLLVKAQLIDNGNSK